MHVIFIYLCSIEYVQDSGEDRGVCIFFFLAEHLYISQFSKVEVSLLLQCLNIQLHIMELEAEMGMKTSNIDKSTKQKRGRLKG